MTSRMSRLSTRGAAVGLGAVLVGGVAVGAAGAVPRSIAPVVAQTEEPADDPTGGEDGADPTDVRVGDLTARIRDHLDELVEAGTISAEQADAVAGHLAEQRAEARPDRPVHDHDAEHDADHDHDADGAPRRGGPLPGGPLPGGVLGGELLEELLGLEPHELLDQLRDGATLDEILDAQGVELDDLVDRVLAEARERFETALDEGRLDGDRWGDAGEWLDRLEERVRAGLDRLGQGD